MKFTFLLLFIGLGLLFAQPSLEEELKSEKNELEKLRTRLGHQQKSLDSLIRSKKSVVEELKRLEESQQLEKKILRQLESVQSKLTTQLTGAKSSLTRAEYALNRQKKALTSRIRTLYIHRPHHQGEGWELLFFNALTDFKHQVWMKRIAQYDSNLVHQFFQEKQEHSLAMTGLEKRKKEVLSFEQDKLKDLEKLAVAENERKLRLEKIQSDEKLRRRVLEELKNNAAALEKIITMLEKRRQAAKIKKKPEVVLQKTGKVCPPVQGRALTKFGLQYHETLKTTTKNLGIEVEGQEGESVKSALAGEVVFVDRLPGYGQGVIVYNGSGYYTIYGNLQQIKVKTGDKVGSCQDIAFIPNPAEISDQKIYFEVRKERESLDPLNWLKRF